MNFTPDCGTDVGQADVAIWHQITAAKYNRYLKLTQENGMKAITTQIAADVIYTALEANDFLEFSTYTDSDAANAISFVGTNTPDPLKFSYTKCLFLGIKKLEGNACKEFVFSFGVDLTGNLTLVFKSTYRFAGAPVDIAYYDLTHDRP